MREIERRFGHGGIRDFEHAYGRTGAITDDTQMALFTLEGLLRAHVAQHDRGDGDVPGQVHAAYKRWLRTQHESYPALFDDDDGWLIKQRELWSVRAPGNTCIHALELDLPDGTPARNDSKGCGGVMRVAPVGLLLANPFDLGGKLAALTHGHPTSTHASAAFAAIIAALVHEAQDLPAAVEHARRLLQAEQDAEETLAAIDLACDLAERRNTIGIPYELGPRAGGGGWVAEEALAIAIYCCLAEPDPLGALRRSVNHDGDTDSTGAIAGNLLGAMHGTAWLPAHWLETLELADLMRTMASDTVEALRNGSAAVENLRARYPAP
jgi:ADP-ribosylglycohydrolase